MFDMEIPGYYHPIEKAFQTPKIIALCYFLMLLLSAVGIVTMIFSDLSAGTETACCCDDPLLEMNFTCL